MELPDLVARLDERLAVDAYADLDASANGLQVGPETGTVEHVAFAVDGVLATVEAAADAGADLLVTHHGVVWGGLDRVTGGTYDRVAALVEADLPLYVAHLPLDGHDELGNAARLCELLDLEVTGPFGELGPEHVGQRARAAEPRRPGALRETLAAELEHAGAGVRHLDFGPDRVADVAVVTGSGADWLAEARREGVDALVTGEGKGKLYHEAREAGVHVYLAGHYATETLGVQALQAVVEGWGLETTYVSHPTGL